MIDAFFDALNPNLFSKKSRRIGLVLLQYCDKLVQRLQADPNLADRDKIESAIEQALKALDLVNQNHKYDKDNPNDPLKMAEENIKQFFQKHEVIEPPRDRVPKDKLAAATRMIRDITKTSPTSTRYPVEVKICDFSAGTVNPISETLNYDFTETSHTLDDLLYTVRLRRPIPMKQHPYLYCRSVKAHRFTQEGLKFKKIEPSHALMGLPIVADNDVVVVYLIAHQREFILLVEGAQFKRGAKGQDGFYIVHQFGDLTSEVIAQNKGKPRTFSRLSEGSWGYTCEPDADSMRTWKYHKDRRQLTPYKGEWFVCIGDSD
ncbi:hypothetical protein FRC04_007515 [Tulasnella sp. 424]|nr:hypothetical protein FRC04_007515 [Tulasnella sp. 424]KAG8958614.1 hypothetical protein FRC05_008774 [Tulasnella sp. 425]